MLTIKGPHRNYNIKKIFKNIKKANKVKVVRG